ncbi:S-layer homology domain-containing protein [Cohnella cholangitidis]|uniref:SLH domain-containing protein n=1 Tax=Cohnella cholangitidis TaxID=2598458 RepID=A0A7G5BWC9_9BACL|nr:S-layer homology domain-containing protein [Cohnella cholangitidis]QMV41263.1 hypothetical protein FPL14_08695 [Cohnella cholangitidis]
MKDRSTYEQDSLNVWDFADRWAIDSSLNGGYPYLRDIQAFISYDKNGSLVGTVPDSASFMPGTTVDIYSGTLDLRKTGSLFGGWNTQADGEGDSYLPGDPILLASNVALYAEWNPASAVATVSSAIGTVSTGGTTNESLTNVPFVTTLAELKAAIVPASNATFEIYDADGTTVATGLATGKKVIVTAQDRISTATYTVTMNAPLSNSATLTSSIGQASAGGTSNETITNVPYGTTLAAFKSAITPAPGAAFEVYDADGTTAATMLSTGKKVIVTAQDGTTKVTYTVTVNGPLSSAATLTSSIGLVSTGGSANGTITNVPYGTTLTAFKAAITPAANATFEVYDADGTTVATTLSTGKKVIVTAQDGTTKVMYTVTVNSAPNGSGSGGGGGGSAAPTNPLVTSTNGRLTLSAGQAGEVGLNDEIILSIPANATDKPLKVTIDNVTDLQKILGNNGVLISKVYEILKDFPDNFKNPVTITITFDSAKLKSNETAVVYYYDEEKKSWVEVPEGKVSGNRIAVKVNHFTKFAVFAAQQPPANPKPTINLNDIAGHWAEAPIKQAVAYGIVTGYSDGTFKPNNTVTRAEFAVMLMNAAKRQGAESKPAFTDAAMIGAWAKSAVGQAVQAGYIKGYADGTFRPNAAITRAEMAMMVAHAAGLSLEANASTGFADDKDIPKWAKGAIAAINKIGYLQGKGSNRFDPNVGATRAEAVTVLLKLLAHKSK